MTSKRAEDLRPSVASAVQTAIMRHKPSEIFICAGTAYLRALDGWPENAPRVAVAKGGQGGKLTSLKAWLHQR